MNQIRNKIAVSFVCICFMLMGTFVEVFAAEIYTEKDFKYQLQEDAIIITEYFGSEEEVTIPPSIAGHPVSKIAKGAFTTQMTVKKLYLPDTIMEIENDAIAQGISVVYNSNTDPVQDPGDAGKDDKEDQENTVPKDEDQGNPEKADGETDASTDGSKDTSTDAGADGSTDASQGGSGNGTGSVAEADVDLQSESSKKSAGAIGAKLSVDSKKRLISTAPDGTITILDDTKEYKAEQQSDGSIKIMNPDGQEVTADAQGKVETVAQETDTKTEKSPLPLVGIVAIVLVILVLLAAGIFLLYRRKHII